MSDRMTEYMSDRMLEFLSDRMSESENMLLKHRHLWVAQLSCLRRALTIFQQLFAHCHLTESEVL